MQIFLVKEKTNETKLKYFCRRETEKVFRKPFKYFTEKSFFNAAREYQMWANGWKPKKMKDIFFLLDLKI